MQDFDNPLECLDLNRLVVRHPEATFFARVSGDSMQDAGLCDGDLIVVDKLVDAGNGDLVVAFIDGEFTVKELRLDSDGAWLIPHNSSYSPIRVTPDNDFMVWGVITFSIRKMRS